jgi:hypothetical protein
MLALAAGHFEIAAGYLLWAMFTRVGLAAISWRHGRRFSAYYIPLQMFAEWATALIKIWVSSHPAKQAWLNRGGRTMDTTRGSSARWLRTAFAHYLYWFSLATFGLIIGCYTGLLPFHREAPLYLRVTPPPLAQLALEPKALVRSILDRTVLVPMIREAPLHSGSRPFPGNGLGAFANLLGYRPVLLSRTLRAPIALNPTSRLGKQTLVDPAVPRIGFTPDENLPEYVEIPETQDD